MSQKLKRTFAPSPMEIPRPVVQPIRTPGTQPVPPPSTPMFGPGTWCSPRPPQSLPPSSAPCWLGAVPQPSMASSSAQGSWWAHAGIGGSSYSWPAANNPTESEVQAWGLDSHPPGGFLNILKSAPQAGSNGTAPQAIQLDSDNNDADSNRTEKRLTWTKDEDLRFE